MKPETVEALVGRIKAIEAEVGVLQSTVEGEVLAPNQRQYLARCFDLLHMELAAVRSYIAELPRS
ncbi:MAG TPA: hypothetical protein VNI54_11650 [Thermoanaerobaculia bacterium]|nr:hypothetical protein [Thermoanaerobaculia bacterium]